MSRVRGIRMSVDCAVGVVSFVCAGAGFCYADLKQHAAPNDLLVVLAQLLAASLSDGDHSLLDRRNRSHTLRAVMRCRAESLLVITNNHQLWCVPSGWSGAFFRKLRSIWHCIVDVAIRYAITHERPSLQKQKHEHKSVKANAPPKTLPPKRAPCKLAPRPPAVGNLPCRFPDTPSQETETSHRWIRLHNTPLEYPVSDAFMALLPVHEGVELLSNWQQKAQRERVCDWDLGRALQAERPTVFLLGDATHAVHLWRSQQGNHDSAARPPMHVISSFLVGLDKHDVVPTLLASPNGHLWDAVVRPPAPCDLRQYAHLCGLSFCLNALQTAAQVVTPSQMRYTSF